MSMMRLEDRPLTAMLLEEVVSFPLGGEERKEGVKGLRKEEGGGAVSAAGEVLLPPFSVLLRVAMQLSVLL
jgi:hypothetical protein